MTNLEKEALVYCAERIEKLASLENAGFHMDKEEDEKIKKAITPYMTWFEIVAQEIKDIVELSDETGYHKKHRLEEIIRYNL